MDEFIEEYNSNNTRTIYLKHIIPKDDGFAALKNITITVSLRDIDMEYFAPLLTKSFDKLTFYADGSKLPLP